MFYYVLHIITVVSWSIFLLQFIKSLQNDTQDKFIFFILSLFFMAVVLFVGTKLMLLAPGIAKSGGWIHVKLSFAVLMIIENLVLAFICLKHKVISSKLYEIMYWVSYISFMIMLFLSLLKPF